jgi:SAM-dependent methyltransferase
MNNTAAKTVDEINQRTMRQSVLEYSAIVHEGLNAQERASLASVARMTRGKRILDIGIGAGRTVGPLRELSEDYVGVDYVEEMVAHCRLQYPGVRFARVDARSMSAFADGSFDLVVFSCNGISMVDHPGRLSILNEVRRVLSPDGVFIFSTCNRQSSQYSARFKLPDFQATRNPAKLAVRCLRFLAQIGYRIVNRLMHLRHEIRCAEYAVINDVCHHYRTMLYFIDPERQIQQLRATGFSGDIRIYDLGGKPGDRTSTDGTIAFVAHKRPAAGN